MTAIVGVLNKQAMAIAAVSALKINAEQIFEQLSGGTNLQVL